MAIDLRATTQLGIEAYRDPGSLIRTEKIFGQQNEDRPIVAILPRGEAIRNFVYTGVLDNVARRAALILLSVIPGDDFQELLQGRYENVLELQAVEERWIVRIVREVLDMAHGRWLWSHAARERWRLRDLEAVSAPARLKRWAMKLACFPFANRPGLEFLSKLESAAGWWFRPTDDYTLLFKKLRPKLVFNGSHVHSNVALQPVRAARRLGVPTAAFIFSWDNLTSQGRIIPAYDYYLVWNDSIRTQLLEMYDSIRPEQVFVTGTPQFDFHFNPEFYCTREEFCRRVGADPARPIVLYSTGIANHMPGEPQIVEKIADTLSEMPGFGPPQLLVRVYPKDGTTRFEELKQRRKDILFPEAAWERAWFSPKLEDSYMLTNSLRHVALGINIASTISLELCMFDKPVINVGYSPAGLDPDSLDFARYYQFDHYRPVVKSGAVKVVWAESDMRDAIIQALSNPEADSGKRQQFMRERFGTILDGQSSRRVAETLLELSGRGRESSRL